MDVARGRGFRGVDVGMSIDPDDRHLIAERFGYSSQRTQSERVISTHHEGKSAFGQGGDNLVCQVSVGVYDAIEIFHVGMSKVFILRLNDRYWNETAITNLIAG
ncbi:hypothetical protein SDC9_163307 [bioreactor metagenome]|uniref:Uncharacterized protein n=1 Tax=bioreactor metagenome TaxID=1076179 RepID=A0A645FNI3_9ZZZZ